MKAKVLFATFPFGQNQHTDVEHWLAYTKKQAKADPRIEQVLEMEVDDTPITMSRNRVAKAAVDSGCDLLVMVDSDMKPDAYLPDNPRKLAIDPSAKPFWNTSLDFWLAQGRPCLVAAPYMGPPPHENAYQFRWRGYQGNNPNTDFRLDQFTREECAERGGVEEVAALPTGLILIDVRAFSKVPPPWFEYEYEDPPFNTKKATTEDVFFTRNCSLAGVPVYINWDAWAGHWKKKCVGKPGLLKSDDIAKSMHEAIVSGREANKKMVMWGEGNTNGHLSPPHFAEKCLPKPEPKALPAPKRKAVRK